MKMIHVRDNGSDFRFAAFGLILVLAAVHMVLLAAIYQLAYLGQRLGTSAPSISLAHLAGFWNWWPGKAMILFCIAVWITCAYLWVRLRKLSRSLDSSF